MEQDIRMIKEAGADKSVLTIKGYEALEKVADGNATKIFMPNNLAQIGSVASAIAETVREKKE